MKINWNNKYLTISVYALLAATVGIVVYKFLNSFTGLDGVFSAVSNVLKPIVYGVVIAYLLSPVEKFFEYSFLPEICKGKLSPKVARYISIALAYLALTVAFVLILYVAVPQLVASIDTIIASLPTYFNYLYKVFSDFLNSNPGSFLAKNFDLSSIEFQSVLNEFQYMLQSSYDAVKSTVTALFEFMFNLILGVAISIYLLCDREKYFSQIKKVFYAFFDTKKVDRFCMSCYDAKEIFNNFMYSKLIGCLIVGIICYIAVLIMGVNNALLISFIIGVTNFIPYFGPLIGTVPCVILIFFDSTTGTPNPTMAIIFIVFILILQQIEGNVIGPKIQGKSVGISSFWVLISVIVFGEFFGVVGMLISVPIFAVIISMFRVFVNKRISEKATDEK